MCFAPGDGFECVEQASNAMTHHNASLLWNEVSPFHGDKQTIALGDTGAVVDTYYGQVYDAQGIVPSGFYGMTDELPPYAGEHLTDRGRGWLRVPFRRVPRVTVHDRKELSALLRSIRSADPALSLMFRGQNREYYLPRSTRAREALYGDPDALEPSLVASAVRAGLNLEDVAAEWSALVQIYIAQHRDRIASWAAPKTLNEFDAEHTRVLLGYRYWGFLVALAQHYGLPSVGLDVTSDIEVALFFALVSLVPDGTNGSHRICRRRADVGEWPVIYLLSSYERFMIDFPKVKPCGLPVARPDAQCAYFLHTGWGYAKNAVARSIFIAVYLDPAGDWGHFPASGRLFPGASDDPFALFLSRVRDWPVSPEFARFISGFYWARPT